MERTFDELLAAPRARLVSALGDGPADGADAAFLASLAPMTDALAKETRLSYLTISFLHTELLKGNPPYLAEAFGDAWVLEEAQAQASYDPVWAFDAWRRYAEEAWGALRKNGLAPPETIFHARIATDLALVRFVVYGMVKYAILQAEEMFAPYAAPPGVFVSVGDYRGKQTMIARFAAPIEDPIARADVAFSVRKDWRFTRFAGARFEGFAFAGVDLGGARFERCVFRDCRFSGCTINDAVFSDCVFEKILFEDCALQGTAFGAAFSDTLFRASNAYADRARAKGFFRPALWQDCKAEGVTWEDCDFSGARFENCVFRGAARTQSVLPDALFEEGGAKEVFA
jgi:hypothetical protein